MPQQEPSVPTAPAVQLAVPELDSSATDLKVRHQGTSDALFRLMVESVADYAIFMLEPSGRVATWNAGAQRFKGYLADEIIGQHFSIFYPREDVEAGKCEHELETATVTGRFEEEGWRLRKDGSRFWANVVITALRDTDGKLVGFGKVTRDLTERRTAEEQSFARRAAEHANQTKDEFLAMLGHELRNPLAPIISALQLLKIRGDARSAREHQVIERQVKQMIRLVDDLLDVSRISNGKIELHRASIDVREALATAVEIAIPLFDRKGQHFEVDTPEVPLIVHGDEARLTQVFSNLLNNAAKYTDRGGAITLTVRHVGQQIVVEVRDNGTGIDPLLLPRMFELFVQGYQAADRAEGGLGIGLTLVRALVELHGGDVEARSPGIGLGSTFVVRLPATEVAPVVEAPVAATRSEQTQVLIVDDNEDARMLLADILESFGHHVRTAGDGKAALALLETFTPDVAVLDIGLPGMDGFELARQIRTLPSQRGIRLLALTGYGQPSDAANAKEAGFDEHLVKPVGMQKLLPHVRPKP